MSDFLSTLVDRSLSRAPAVEPRRLSLFEPIADGGSLNVAPGDREWFAGKATTQVEETAPRVFREPPGAPQPPQVTVIEERIAAPGPPKAITQVRRVHEPARPIIETRTDNSLTTEAPIPRRVRTDTDRVEPAPLPTSSAIREPVRASAPPEREHVAPSIQTVERGSEIPRPLVPSPRPLFQPPSPTAIRPTIAVRPTAPTAAAAPAPTIHVTIGRVEIRATSAPASPTRSSHPRQPKLALEDYLKSRQGAR